MKLVFLKKVKKLEFQTSLLSKSQTESAVKKTSLSGVYKFAALNYISIVVFVEDPCLCGGGHSYANLLNGELASHLAD